MDLYITTLFAALIAEFKKFYFKAGHITIYNNLSFGVVFEKFVNGVTIPGNGYELVLRQEGEKDEYLAEFWKIDTEQTSTIKFNKNSEIQAEVISHILFNIAENNLVESPEQEQSGFEFRDIHVRYFVRGCILKLAGNVNKIAEEQFDKDFYYVLSCLKNEREQIEDNWPLNNIVEEAKIVFHSKVIPNYDDFVKFVLGYLNSTLTEFMDHNLRLKIAKKMYRFFSAYDTITFEAEPELLHHYQNVRSLVIAAFVEDTETIPVI